MSLEQQGIDSSRQRYQVIPRVLAFITHQGDVLLLKGAPSKRIWPNLYNGVGGHVERHETPLDAVRREIREEVGLNDVSDLRLRGIVSISTSAEATGIMMFVYSATAPTRDLHASSEGVPEWVDPDSIDPDTCVVDLPILMPRVLSMQAHEPPFFAHYWYDENGALQTRFSTLP